MKPRYALLKKKRKLGRVLRVLVAKSYIYMYCMVNGEKYLRVSYDSAFVSFFL
jgi:hypothetical protein